MFDSVSHHLANHSLSNGMAAIGLESEVEVALAAVVLVSSDALVNCSAWPTFICSCMNCFFTEFISASISLPTASSSQSNLVDRNLAVPALSDSAVVDAVSASWGDV